MATTPLTPKQEAFVLEMLKDGNATAAAERAGYKHPNKQGPRLLVNVGIAAALAAARESRAKRTLVTADRVVRELAVVAFSDVTRIVDPHTGALCPVISRRARRAISSVKVRRTTRGEGDSARTEESVEFKLWSKTAALDMLARHTGVYPEKGDGGADDEPPMHDREE